MKPLSEKAIGYGELNDDFDFDNHIYKEEDVTKPIEVDKFIFVCHDCHINHGKLLTKGVEN